MNMYQGICRREVEALTICKCGSSLYRKGETIYCCKCEYTRPARRQEDKRIATKEDWDGK
jgi:uncharacterized Zn finger protein (UPF0148 family)